MIENSDFDVLILFFLLKIGSNISYYAAQRAHHSRVDSAERIDAKNWAKMTQIGAENCQNGANCGWKLLKIQLK